MNESYPSSGLYLNWKIPIIVPICFHFEAVQFLSRIYSGMMMVSLILQSLFCSICWDANLFFRLYFCYVLLKFCYHNQQVLLKQIFNYSTRLEIFLVLISYVYKININYHRLFHVFVQWWIYLRDFVVVVDMNHSLIANYTHITRSFIIRKIRII